MDKCPSIIISDQTISDLLRHSFGEVHICYSKCASTKSISRVDFLSTSNLISSLCVCVCVRKEHEVVLTVSQMSDPNFFGSDKWSKWSNNV